MNDLNVKYDAVQFKCGTFCAFSLTLVKITSKGDRKSILFNFSYNKLNALQCVSP